MKRLLHALCVLLLAFCILMFFAGCADMDGGQQSNDAVVITARSRDTKSTPSTTQTAASTTKKAATTTAKKPAKATTAQTTATAALTTAAEQPTSYSYVCNTNTKKFHVPNCSSVQKINDENRLNYSGSRADLITSGYVPCKRCNP